MREREKEREREREREQSTPSIGHSLVRVRQLHTTTVAGASVETAGKVKQ